MTRLMFFLFFFLVLGSLVYVLWHVWCILPFAKWGKWVVVLLMAACLLSMFTFMRGRLDQMPLNTASVLYDISTSSVIILLYLVMAFLVMDVARLVRILPAGWLHESWTATLTLAVLMVVVFVAGNIHYYNKVRVDLPLTTSKPLGRDYKIVMASDLHLGYHNRRADLARWVDLINAEHPDLVLIAGDIIDISTRPLLEENMAEEMRRINAPVYACLGNHEYYSSEPKARRFYKDAGIRLLVDSTAAVDGVITIVGRDDRTNPARKSLAEVVGNAADSTFTIVLDHQPYELEKAEQSKVDIQFSGHTHRGQVWPISWVTDAIYECSWGPWRRGDTHFYVSSGLGIWGGKFRIGTQSEYVVATLSPKVQP